MKLIKDEVSEIRAEAVELLVEMLDIYSYRLLEEEVLPTLKNYILKVGDSATDTAVVKSLPIILQKLGSVHEKIINDIYHFITTIADRCNDTEANKALIHTLPAITSALGADKFES